MQKDPARRRFPLNERVIEVVDEGADVDPSTIRWITRDLADRTRDLGGESTVGTLRGGGAAVRWSWPLPGA